MSSKVIIGCSNCAKENPPLRCSKCKIVYYCDKECQKMGWKTHKNACGDLKNHGEQKDDIVKKFIHKNEKLYWSALQMFPLLRDYDRFICFTKNPCGQGDICYMTEAEIRKSITPPEVLENEFWKATFQIHKDKKADEISILIPYSEQGGHYHYLTKLITK